MTRAKKVDRRQREHEKWSPKAKDLGRRIVAGFPRWLELSGQPIAEFISQGAELK
jgi:hypothetical protein